MKTIIFIVLLVAAMASGKRRRGELITPFANEENALLSSNSDNQPGPILAPNPAVLSGNVLNTFVGQTSGKDLLTTPPTYHTDEAHNETFQTKVILLKVVAFSLFGITLGLLIAIVLTGAYQIVQDHATLRRFLKHIPFFHDDSGDTETFLWIDDDIEAVETVIYTRFGGMEDEEEIVGEVIGEVVIQPANI